MTSKKSKSISKSKSGKPKSSPSKSSKSKSGKPKLIKSKSSQPKLGKAVIGWREWIGLPKFGVPSIKVKVDTGARTSSLHAFDITPIRKRGIDMVRFSIHPEQRSSRYAVTVEAKLVDKRKVRPSSGESELRYVVLTDIQLMGLVYPVELTLTSRDAMGFRMLLGRQAIRDRFTVDPGKSFLNGRRLLGSRRMKKKVRPKKPTD